MLEHDPELRAKYGFSESEVADLKGKTAAVSQYYSALVGRSGSKGEADQAHAQKALKWNAAEVELAKTDPEQFIAKHRDAWTAATGLGEGDLDRLIGTIEFRRLIRDIVPAMRRWWATRTRRRAWKPPTSSMTTIKPC